MRKAFFTILAVLAFFSFTCHAMAHFGIIIPSRSTVTERSQSHIVLDIAFAHPYKMHGMEMERPAAFFVMDDNKKEDLSEYLTQAQFMKHSSWQCKFAITRPGAYRFAASPIPYYEAAEDRFIVHYPKTVIGAYGGDAGWDEPMDLPIEIVPLTRPFGNYAGNTFTGKVLRKGQPLANANVEIECLNGSDAHVAPNVYFETQLVKTDSNGIFTFAIPWAGWWGFAALAEADGKLEKDGIPKVVEEGAVIWLEFVKPELRQK